MFWTDYTNQPVFGSEENEKLKYACQKGYAPDGSSKMSEMPNAIIGGKNAYISKSKIPDPGWFDACLQNRDIVIWLQYMMYKEHSEEVKQNGLTVFKHVLESFKFDDVVPKSVLPDF